jgi:putative hemolysin
LDSTQGEPPSHIALQIFSIVNQNLSAGEILTALICGGIILLLILCSAIISSSENAFFSLSATDKEVLAEEKSRASTSVQYLLSHPKSLLATILIANTFVNIAIVMLSTIVIDIIFNFGNSHIIAFLIEVILVTFILVLFGEVMPKIYASQNNVRVAKFVALPMFSLSKVLYPFVYLLVKSTSIIDKRITKKGHVLSVDELTHAIDITAEEDTPKEEKIILKSIVNFGNTSVTQIMRQRPDISALNQTIPFIEVKEKITEWGYSRMPVYEDNLDNITGVLYIKDLLPKLQEAEDYKWQKLVRRPYFVPESKKIDDLLKEFQSKRVHLAIVVDEFGGTSGIVTMEDILEEIFGEIHDEFDEDETFYSRLNEHTFVFEAKMLINDMCRFMEVDTDVFDEVRNEADTVGGMLLEISGELPEQGQIIPFKEFRFHIESVDKRRIKRVKVEILNEEDEA